MYTSETSQPALVLADCRTWPVIRVCERPPVDEEAEAQGLTDEGEGEGEQQQPRDVVLPKVLVTWFVLDDRKNSLIRFSVFDPNFSLMQTYTTATRRPRRKPASRFADVSTDPLEHLRQFGRNHIANFLDDDVFEKMYAFLGPAAKFRDVRRVLDDVGDPTHISNALTLKRALEILHCVNANTLAFDRIPYMTAKKSFVFPEEPVFKTYVLHPRMCFWYSPQYLGIGYTLWPGISKKRSDFALALIMGNVKIQNGQIIDMAEEDLETETSSDNMPLSLSEYAARHRRSFVTPLVDKRDLLLARPRLLHYETGNQIMLWQAEAEAAIQYVRQLLPEDPEKNPAAYAVYCEGMRRFRLGQLEKFCNIWTLDTTVDNKPISVAHKAVIKYLGDIVRKSEDGSVTLHLPYLDEEMSVYGNLCIMRMLLLSKVSRIINTKIPFMAGGLLSTFDKKRDGEPKFHLSLSGPPAAGKTFPLHFFIKKNFITGTFDVISSQSEKANNIDGHLGACVILCDEPPKWYSDAEAEDKNYEKVQETKNVFTQHQHNRSVLKMEEHEGRSFRLQHNICTDDPRAWAFCTNKPRNKRHALGTRIFQVTLPKPRHAPESFDYPVHTGMAGDTRKFFQLDQALCVEVKIKMCTLFGL